MTEQRKRSSTPGEAWRDTPPTFKGGIAVAIIAWLVSLSSAQLTTVNGEVTACNYFDLAKVGGAAALVGLAIAGFLANSRARRRALPTWLAATIAAVLIVVAALLMIRGLGVAMSPCQSSLDTR